MITDTLHQWHIAIRISHMAHIRAAAYNAKMHRLFGIPVIVATTLVGTSVFSSLGESPHVAVAVMTGMLSMAAAVLSALQTFFNYSGEAEKHRNASVKFGMLRREIEEMMDVKKMDHEMMQAFKKDFRTRWDEVESASPPLSQRIYDQSYALVKERTKYSTPTPATHPLNNPAIAQ